MDASANPLLRASSTRRQGDRAPSGSPWRLRLATTGMMGKGAAKLSYCVLASEFLQLPGILWKGLLVPQAQGLFGGCDPVTEPLCVLLVCSQGGCLGLQLLLLLLDFAAELWEEKEESNVGKKRGAYGEGGNPFSSPHWMSGPTGSCTHKVQSAHKLPPSTLLT